MKPKDMNLKIGDVIEWLGIERTVMEEPEYHTDGAVHLTLSHYGTGIFRDQDFTLIPRANQTVKIGDKIKSDKYSSNPSGLYTVCVSNDGGSVCATYDDEPNNDLEWFFFKGQYTPYTPTRADDTTPNTPRTWGELTDAEKGALLLAEFNGEVIQWRCGDVWIDLESDTLAWGDPSVYRIKPEPVVKKHALRIIDDITGSVYYGTVSLIDGIPDTSSIRMVDGEVASW